MPDLADEDEFTELVGAQFSRVDLVQAPANGAPGFLVMKQDEEAAGLMDPGFVRDLIAKADPEPEFAPAARDDVTMTGSPAAIAKLIHGAPVAKAKNDTASRKHDAATGAAMPDGSYPIENEADLGKAIHAVGRGGASHNAIRKHVISRAKSLGASSKIPDNWAADGSLKEDSVSKSDTVTKDMGPELDEGVDGLDPTIPLAAPDEDAPGDPTDPGSPAWEAIDAATAQKWTSILARAKVALGVMADREMLEAASADPDDAENAWDLQDAGCAIDYVISVLAPFAVAEQSEADCGAEEMEAIGKALGGFDAGPLDAIEGLCAIAKAGRVLSSANEALIRTAADGLQKVLMSLPAAPVADDPVTKEAAMAADQTSTEAAPETEVAKAEEAAAPEEVAKEDATAPEPAAEVDVAKADKEPQVVVYNAKGEVVGIVDPAKIVPVQGAAPAGEAKAAAAADPAPAPAADPAPAPEPAPAAAPAADMTPAPAAAAGTPAEGDEDDVAKATENDTDERKVLKSLVAEAVREVLDARAPAEDIAKQADVAGALAEVEVLKGRIATLEEQPAMPKVFTNGAVPPPGTLRGQDQGSVPVDVAKAKELKQTLYTGSAAEQNKAHRDMQEMAIAQLAAMRR